MSGESGKSIVIAGDGAAAWVCAATLSRSLDLEEWTVTVISTGSKGDDLPFETGDATLPPAPGFMPGMFMPETALVARAGASWSFGIALSGWVAADVTYFHPFGTVGADFGPIPFHQIVQRLRQQGVSARLANYSLAAMAAQAGRFQLPTGDPGSALSTCQQGLHVDMTGLAGTEREAAIAAGVRESAGSLVKIEQEEGAITALLTDRGERLEAQLFIDCSGTHSCLLGELPRARWEKWSPGLPCNRLLTAVVSTPQAPLPYSHSEARPWGWLQYLPLQGKTVLHAIYRDDLASEADIRAVTTQFADGASVQFAGPEELAFGRFRRPWVGNCVALGTAAALIDPVGVTNLHLLQSGINRLVGLLPGGAPMDIVAAEFNRQAAAEHAHARDFALLHYRLNGREGEPLWDQARKAPVPPTLGYKLQLYANLGRVAMYDFEPVEETAWINLFDEHGVQPRRLHPIVQGVGVEPLKKHAERVRSAMMKTLARMPSHAEFLSRVNSEFANR